MVDGSNESLYHADEEMHPLVRTFSPSQTIFQNLDVVGDRKKIWALRHFFLMRATLNFFKIVNEVDFFGKGVSNS